MTVAKVVARAGAVLLLVASLGWFAVAVAARAGIVHVSQVMTGSMAPAIESGAFVAARPAPADTLVPGDAIQFLPPAPYGNAARRPVLHRVVSVLRQDGTVLVQTKGDANATPDPWLLDASRSDVYRVIAQSPPLPALLWARRVSPFGAALMAAGGACIWIGVRSFRPRRPAARHRRAVARDDHARGHLGRVV